ncbi:hypothetical protein Bca4012_032267 [Brassica carinata]|uniref:NYN domain-containing protein n=1 Tax=Brassica carinata TaxID=52824 RepID=A0A8X7USY2_BRACI|nr:hypothetical protein Bca52824_047040 [Brassica carinata]
MMMKKVKKATPELATSKTIVWWDMDSCPLPNGYEPSRVGPRIDTELKNQGYNGPLTIIGIGNLEGVPHDFLKALSSGGVVIKQLPLGSDMMSCVRRALFSREPRFEPPLSMMLITAVHADLLEDVICVFFNRGPLYNLLLAFPAVTEHADPEPPTLLVDNFGGEWVWDRLGLLKDPDLGSANYDTRRQDTGCESHCCGLCDDFSSDSFDDFKAHLDSPQHAVKMHEYLSYLAGRFYRVLENFESAVRLQESYLAKVEAKRREFVRWFGWDDSDDEDDTPKPQKSKRSSLTKPNLGKKFKAVLLCKASSLKKKATAKPKKPSKSKRLAIAEEAECSLPKNAATTMSS